MHYFALPQKVWVQNNLLRLILYLNGIERCCWSTFLISRGNFLFKKMFHQQALLGHECGPHRYPHIVSPAQQFQDLSKTRQASASCRPLLYLCNKNTKCMSMLSKVVDKHLKYLPLGDLESWHLSPRRVTRRWRCLLII